MKVTKGKYTLTHEEALDTNGFLVDIVHFVETLPNGHTVEHQLVPTMKVRNYQKDTDILDSTQGYTENDLIEMLEERIKQLAIYNS